MTNFSDQTIFVTSIEDIMQPGFASLQYLTNPFVSNSKMSIVICRIWKPITIALIGSTCSCRVQSWWRHNCISDLLFFSRLLSWKSCQSSETEPVAPASGNWTKATALWLWLSVAPKVPAIAAWLNFLGKKNCESFTFCRPAPSFAVGLCFYKWTC